MFTYCVCFVDGVVIVHRSHNASLKCRWWSSVILLSAFAPIVCLYCVWLPLTCLGKIKAADVPENEKFGRPTEWNSRNSTIEPPKLQESMHEVQNSLHEENLSL